MENGVAPSVITARSAMWNSGRLASIRATRSPRRTPSAARPPASASTRSRSSLQVCETSSSLVCTATRSGWSSTVIRKASAMVAAPTAREDAAAVGVLMARAYRRGSTRGEDEASRPLPRCEAAVVELVDVVAQPDHREHDHEREAHEAGPLHHRERDRPAADLLRHRPED